MCQLPHPASSTRSRSYARAGIVTNWEDMEKIWHHTFFNELRVAPEVCALVGCASVRECDAGVPLPGAQLLVASCVCMVCVCGVTTVQCVSVVRVFYFVCLPEPPFVLCVRK